MISKANCHNNGSRLAAYLTTGKEGERAELWQLRGFEATDIKSAFRDVEIMAGATKCQQPFFHVQVRNREGETLTRQQWEQAADRIERMLRLKDQPRAIVFHIDEKTGHEHMHIAWSRIDENTMKAIPLPFFKEQLKKVSRELEAHFALEPVTNQREGNIRFAPTRAEQEQARRLGMDIHAARNTIRDCWDRSDCGGSFHAALENEGLTLAQGDRRDFVVVDREGGLHALGKRTLDMTAAKIRDRLSDLSRDDLPTVEMARASNGELNKQKPEQRSQEKQVGPWDCDRDDRASQDAVISAAIEKEKSERTFVASRTRENVLSQRQAQMGSRENERPADFKFPEKTDNRMMQDARTVATGNFRRHAALGKKAERSLGKAFDLIGNAIESLFAPAVTPEQKREAEKATDRREAETRHAIDFTKYTAEILRQRQEAELEQHRERDERGRQR